MGNLPQRFVFLDCSAIARHSLHPFIIIFGEINMQPFPSTDYSDLLYGTNDADVIEGKLGNDVIYGGSGGDDIIIAGPDSPVLGFTDDDVVFGDTFAGGNTNDKIYGGYGNDTLYGDSYEGGGGGSDTLIGDDGNDTLIGGDGNDFLDGGIHTDTLFGGNDNDTLVGGSGNDGLNGGSGYDVAAYYRSFTTYNATFTSNGAVQIQNVIDGTDLLTGIELINFTDGFYNVHTGDDSNNALTADPNVWSFLYGGGGDDILTGGSYNDVLAGSIGNDTLSGGSGCDTAVYFGDYTSYSASFTNNGAVQLTGIEGTDLLTGIEQINFAGAGVFKVYTGDAGNNTLTADPYTLALLYGGGGNDILTSGFGNDTLEGGAGNDRLTGGAYNDQFKFGNSNGSPFGSANTDTITDFVAGTDKIVLGRASFSALKSAIGGNLLAREFAIVTSDSQAQASSAKVVYNSANGNLFYNQNGSSSGFGKGGQFATLTGSPDNLSSSDFLVVSA
jgi:Ca2+-binding RTX toxin-like protein